ncbi:hypothetical protein SAMN04489761_0763 [Tenacibaculum sp. MAR_2009_124]|uniref:hypothetical protein n=1 Tax=Tenacibaculum sp. MAR_2009_124 TaxID=1250059 RepID=UPI00089A9C93|nr:hypothetical protein [Tenacibaculum sp. MAR_2009_124]SEB44571.1 hypothetical protein SAMN04489761_0763 [Tenacibaculum sp. MAR_2009_124]
MSANHDNKDFKQLLDKLQQESWQLELIISGFAIFGLLSAYPEIQVSLLRAEANNIIYIIILLLISKIACAILLFNLLIHVILRGLWIGALGLRYVSGEIEFDELNYQNRFKKYLKKKIVSFDKYVATLENYCSVLFAISFLLIFYVISITLAVLSIIAVVFFIIDNEALHEGFRIALGVFLLVILAIGMILTFIDFITQGFLKKKKWLSKIYFPFYWLFSFITLSFLYRALVYNFLDNKFTKRISFLLVPIYIIILIIVTAKYQTSNHLGNIKTSATLYLNKTNYENLLINNEDFVEKASIQSKTISDAYVKLFIVFSENLEERLYNFHPSLKPVNDRRGLKTKIKLNNNKNRLSRKKRDSLAYKYIEVFNTMNEVYIDSVKYPTDFLIGTNVKSQTGFETYLPTKGLSDGKHLLKVRRKVIKKKDTILRRYITIPFWYFE